MDENELLCDNDGQVTAEWCCICVFPLKKMCLFHKDKHLNEPLQPGDFHFILPISATRLITTPDIFRQKRAWVFGLAGRQRQLRECLEPLSKFSAEMNSAFEDLRHSLSDRKEQIVNKVQNEFEQKVRTAIEETSIHALDPFDPAPGLQTLLWSEETKSADFPKFKWEINTYEDCLEGAFAIVFDTVVFNRKYPSITFGNFDLFQQELEHATADLAQEVREQRNEIQELEMKYQNKVLKSQALIEELIQRIKDTEYKAEHWEKKCIAEMENTEIQMDTLRKQLQSAKDEALQWEEKRLTQWRRFTAEIDDIRKQSQQAINAREIQIIGAEEEKQPTREKQRPESSQPSRGRREITAIETINALRSRHKSATREPEISPVTKLQIRVRESRKKLPSGELPRLREDSMRVDPETYSPGKRAMSQPKSTWTCFDCHTRNNQDDLKCMKCKTRKNACQVVLKHPDVRGKCRRCGRSGNLNEGTCNACRASGFEHWTCQTCRIENTSCRCSKCGATLVS